MTVMGDVLMEELSDRGSIPLRSTRTRSVELGFYKNVFMLVYKIEDSL